MTPNGGWTRKAVLTAVAPWLAVAGLVASFWSEQPLLLAASGLASAVAMQQALRAAPRANTDSDWWTLYRRESHTPGEPSNEASVWCFRIAHVGLAVLLIAFLALVIASALSFLGLVDS